MTADSPIDEKLAAAIEDAFDSSADNAGDWFSINIEAFLKRLRLNGYDMVAHDR